MVEDTIVLGVSQENRGNLRKKIRNMDGKELLLAFYGKLGIISWNKIGY